MSFSGIYKSILWRCDLDWHPGALGVDPNKWTAETKPMKLRKAFFPCRPDDFWGGTAFFVFIRWNSPAD